MKRLFLLIGVLLLILSAVFYMSSAIYNHLSSLSLLAASRTLFSEIITPAPMPVFMVPMTRQVSRCGLFLIIP